MFVVTFYSYKGGVGRTLALVNTAFRLASKGKRVFVLDFDLEAPGVDGFSVCKSQDERPGIVEYVSHFRDEGNVEPLGNYVSEVDPAKTHPGKVYFMGAGRKDARYQQLLSKLDWKYFYGKSRGFLFVENLKAGIEKEYAPDYVLVDSRTGLTDTAGICTLQFPDLVVFLFNLNNQNLAGVSKVYRSVRFNKFFRDIKSLLVASPIPDVPDYIGVRKERLDYARKIMGVDSIDVVLPFDPFVAFEEMVLPEGEPKTYLARSYDLLCEAVMTTNKAEMLSMLKDVERLVQQGNYEIAEQKYQEMISVNEDNPQACREYGKFLRMRGKKREAVDYLTRSIKIHRGDPETLEQLVTIHLELGQGNEAAGFLDELLTVTTDAQKIENIGDAFQHGNAPSLALKAYERAVELKETSSAHLEIGNTYMRLGKPELAVLHYKRSIEMSPTSLAYVYNHGYALSQLGDPAATEYFKQAIQLFELQDNSSSGPAASGNAYQAMSHAFLGVGDIQKARKMLEKALEAAQSLPENRMIFSSVQYKQISAKYFIEETKHLLKKCKRQ